MKFRVEVLVLLVAGCMNEGTVTEKVVVPEHTTHWIWMMPIMHSTGKSTFTTFIPIPMTSHYPEQYAITIAQGEKRRTLYVKRNTFDGLAVGQYYCKKKEDCSQLTKVDVREVERH